MLHIDLDEFVYARQAFALTLPEVLRRAVEVSSGAVEAIVLPWLVFGSSGRVEQPRSVRTGFTLAAPTLGNCTKWLARTAAITEWGIHWPGLLGCSLSEEPELWRAAPAAAVALAGDSL